MKRPLPLACLSDAGLTSARGVSDAAFDGPPSAGSIGRLELSHHWERMTSQQQRDLVAAARRIVAPVGNSDLE